MFLIMLTLLNLDSFPQRSRKFIPERNTVNAGMQIFSNKFRFHLRLSLKPTTFYEFMLHNIVMFGPISLVIKKCFEFTAAFSNFNQSVCFTFLMLLCYVINTVVLYIYLSTVTSSTVEINSFI